jgi:(1->4)-alpha-D-glucan 1-alpha-D-glucosylmutase
MTEPPAELRATYRLQLTSEFGFESARSLIPYLRDLGVSHLYLSPSLQARAGSTHGYDQIDPSRLSEALGGEEAFRRLAGDARGAGMGVVLDVVPNHMAADDENRFWADPELRRKFFDIDPVSGRWRRFFDIDDLAGIRQEDPEVFEATHGFVLRLVQQGLLDGLRVDHPDGLADPQGYLRRLRDGGARRVWVEKILSPTERLPGSWPVSGTVGYEFLNDVSALFVDPEGEAPLTALWERVSGDLRPFGAWALEAKLEQARTTFAPEVERLTRLAPELDADAVALALSALPVYRTYVEPSAGEFLTRFQQTSPAIMAKGVEDTTFYRYARLLALNEVGGDPARFGLGVEEFHSGNAERQVRFPEGLLTTMTHDAKRSADVRARVGALAGMAEEWADRVERWMALSDELCGSQGGPDDAERYFIFQTLAGAWPIEAERLDAYLEKALREAKRNTNWTCPNADWEEAVKRFTRRLVADRRFMDDFEPFAQRVAARGRRSALGQMVLKLSSPGVPDIYQGDELEFRALVDPDNRRPVDWSLRRALLARLLGGGQLPDEPKLTVTARLLGLRARRPGPFARGRYEPLDAGPDTCAFLRGDDVLVAVRLRPGAEPPSLAGTGRPRGEWRELLGYSQLGVAVWERA